MKAILSIKNKLQNYFKATNNLQPDFIPFFRITVGLILLFHFISILPDFNYLYGMNSVIPTDIHTLYLSENILYFNEIIDLFTQLTNSEVLSVLIFKILFIVFCILIIIGFYSRLFSLLLLILQVSLVKSSYYYSYGADYFCSMSLVYLMIFPCDEYFSIRNIYRTLKEKTNFYFVRKTFQIHLAFSYFVSGIEKLSGYNWRNGEAVWKAIHLPNFSNDFNINLDFLGNYPFILVMMAWFTILVELLYPLFISIKRTRLLWLCLTVSLHLGIALLLNLYFFSAIMITWNIANFYHFPKKNLNRYE